MKLFWKALKAKLITSTALKTATGYTTSNLSIARAEVPQKSFQKGLFFEEVETIDKEYNANTVYETSVKFTAIGGTQEAVSDILRELEKMFENADVRLAYMSITNSEIQCVRSWKEERGKITKQQDLNVFHGEFRACYVWAYK